MCATYLHYYDYDSLDTLSSQTRMFSIVFNFPFVCYLGAIMLVINNVNDDYCICRNRMLLHVPMIFVENLNEAQTIITEFVIQIATPSQLC